jgi:hypothetical protein
MVWPKFKVQTSPTGLSFSIEGTTYNSTQAPKWILGSSHTVATTTPQAGAAGTQYTFTSWSDGGALSHSVTASTSPAGYTANFSTQYMLTSGVSPAGSGTVSPATGYQTAGAPPVTLVATAAAGYAFVNWTSSPGTVGNPTSSSTTITMSAPENVTANFTTHSPGVYSPVSGSILASNSATFEWGPYPSATAYWLDVGSTSGGNNYWQSGSLSATTFSQTVNSLPENGSTVWVTWWYLVGGSWQYTEYSYNAFGSTGPAIATLTSPTPNGSTLSGSSVVFSWQAGTDNISNYWIDVGSTAGGNNYYQSGKLPTSATSVTVNGLPTDGSEIYVTLYSLVNSVWLYNSYNFYAFSASSCVSTITSPAPGSELTAYSDTFSWTVSSSPGCSGAVTAYELDAGTDSSENYYDQSGNIGNVCV